MRHARVTPHKDPGLQPERTTMAWGRTMMALATVSAIFLRWLPHHGLPVLMPLAISTVAATVICFTQRHRYRTSSRGIMSEKISTATFAVLWTAITAIALGASGMGLVLRM